jgi:hypothetical protein
VSLFGLPTRIKEESQVFILPNLPIICLLIFVWGDTQSNDACQSVFDRRERKRKEKKRKREREKERKREREKVCVREKGQREERWVVAKGEEKRGKLPFG